MHNNQLIKLTFIGLFVVGVATGILTINLILPENSGNIRSDSIDSHIRNNAQLKTLQEITFKIDKANKKIAEIYELLQVKNIMLEIESPETNKHKHNEIEKVGIEPTLSTGPKEGKAYAEANWTKHLEKEIVNVLIENGLTPFNNKIALLIRPASRYLKELRVKEKEEIDKMLNIYSIKDEMLSVEIKTIQVKYKVLRENILREFRMKIDKYRDSINGNI